jgi:outer membrane protein OmpA-like peptidoglycan-associated protein
MRQPLPMTLSSSSPAGEPDRLDKAAWRSIIARYQQPSAKRALWQLIRALVPYVLLWYAIYRALEVSLWLTIPNTSRALRPTNLRQTAAWMRNSRLHGSVAIAFAVGGSLLAVCSAAPLATDVQAEAREQARQLEEARDINVEARRNAQELRARIDDMHADITDRGLVLTLGDVLFGDNTAELNTAGSHRLDNVVGFLNRYPHRNAVIEGYDDSMGNDRYNRALSQRRADSVKIYLVRQGIGSNRLTVRGSGEESPVGDNGSATDQQNRHVEVVIEDQLTSSR